MSTPLIGHRYLNEDGEPRVQTLEQHCKNVAFMCSRACEPLGLAKLGYITGLLHDMGKAHPLVQARLLGKTSQKYNHSSAGMRWLWLTYGDSSNTDYRLAAQMAALAIGDHHGTRSDVYAPDGSEPWKSLHLDTESARTMYEQSRDIFFSECVSEQDVRACFEQAAGEVAALRTKIKSHKAAQSKEQWSCSMQMMLGLCQRFLYSALVDADWTDTACFESGAPLPEPDIPQWAAITDQAEKFLSALPCLHPIDTLRQEISEQCVKAAAASQPGVYRLYLPTGGGKTYTGLRYCLHAAQAQAAPPARIFYFAPFCSILGQNAAEFRKVLGSSDLVLEHHSNVILDERSADEDNERRELLLSQTQRWQGVPLIATTMVQFLNTLFAAPRQNVRRMSALASSILWFDEIQSLPTRHTYLFNLAINFLAYYLGCTVVLCTATQPPLAQLDYPIRLTMPAPELVPDFQLRFEQFRRTSIVPVAGEFTADTLATFVNDKLVQNNSILVVLNTRAAVEQLYKALKGLASDNVVLYCLTTYLCPQHRNNIIARLRDLLYNDKKHCNGEHGKKLICVSTQLIEAGVDLSFDCVIRSITSLPSVAQAAGRCNRHGENSCRPVYMVDCEPMEKIERSGALLELAEARKATMQLLQKLPETSDLLSPESILAYYNIFYNNDWIHRELPAPIHKPKELNSHDLLSLFSFNPKSQLAFKERTGKKIGSFWQLMQAFGTAEENFHALDEDTIPVIVPYGDEGKALISQLFSMRHLSSGFFRQAQKYTVSLIPYQKSVLENNSALTKVLDGAVLVLQEQFYSEETGVCFDANPLPELFI